MAFLRPSLCSPLNLNRIFMEIRWRKVFPREHNFLAILFDVRCSWGSQAVVAGRKKRKTFLWLLQRFSLVYYAFCVMNNVPLTNDVARLLSFHEFSFTSLSTESFRVKSQLSNRLWSFILCILTAPASHNMTSVPRDGYATTQTRSSSVSCALITRNRRRRGRPNKINERFQLFIHYLRLN